MMSAYDLAIEPFGNPLETWFQGVSNRLETVWKLIRNPFETF